nr:DUF2500 family protein [Kineosporia babensis]
MGFRFARTLGRMRQGAVINQNAASQSYEAVVVGRRVDVTGAAKRQEEATHFQYLTFEGPDQARQEFLIKNGDHHWIRTGARGLLSHQGLQYTGFVPHRQS